MKHRPPSINRLAHYDRPLVMAGDPQWYGSSKNPWQARQQAVYADMMAAKKHSANSGNDPAQSCGGKPREKKL